MEKRPPNGNEPADPPANVRLIGSRPISDADYRLMIEAVTDYAIFLIDVNGVVRSWNAGAERLKGYAADEVIGRHFSVFYPQELKDKDWPQYELQEAGRTGRFEDEGWRVRKDGSRFWANIIITRLLTPSGDLRGFSKITRDLSERRRQEELLRGSEERFRLLVESVKDYAIFMLDPAGFIVSWNPGAEQTLGYKAAEIIGKHLSVFYPEDEAVAGGPENELETALQTGTFEDEGWRVRKDHTRFWANVVLTSIYDETGRHRGFTKITRDMTESRKISVLESESRRVTNFIAMLGHELRNPLAPMTNAIAVMERAATDSDIFDAARSVLDRQLKQMKRLVDDLLDVGRITAGKIRLEKKPVLVRDALAQAVEAVAPTVQEKDHSLTVDAGGQDLWVVGDRARLAQVITNLLGNAAKYTPPRGQLHVSLVADRNVIEIRVKDNGPGIPESLRANIFNLFVQGEQDVARSQGGLGLGLALVEQLVTLHGGDVAAYSNPEVRAGSEFVVRLPRIAAPPSNKRRAENQRKRILVVDDNHDSADTLGMLVRSLGYEAEVVYDGDTALAAVIANVPDVVLLDLGLPTMDGYEVARRIEAEVVDPPELVAISGYGQDSDREATFRAGFHAHLSKPVSVDDLAGVLKRLFS